VCRLNRGARQRILEGSNALKSASPIRVSFVPQPYPLTSMSGGQPRFVNGSSSCSPFGPRLVARGRTVRRVRSGPRAGWTFEQGANRQLRTPRFRAWAQRSSDRNARTRAGARPAVLGSLRIETLELAPAARLERGEPQRWSAPVRYPEQDRTSGSVADRISGRKRLPRRSQRGSCVSPVRRDPRVVSCVKSATANWSQTRGGTSSTEGAILQSSRPRASGSVARTRCIGRPRKGRPTVQASRRPAGCRSSGSISNGWPVRARARAIKGSSERLVELVTVTKGTARLDHFLGSNDTRAPGIERCTAPREGKALKGATPWAPPA
jgi:hypothetical protein